MTFKEKIDRAITDKALKKINDRHSILAYVNTDVYFILWANGNHCKII